MSNGIVLTRHRKLLEAQGFKKPTLKPCPFCGASGEDLMLFCDPSEGLNNSGPSRRVQCAGCNIEAPFYDTEDEAIAAWNRRMERDSAWNDAIEAAAETAENYVSPAWREMILRLKRPTGGRMDE